MPMKAIVGLGNPGAKYRGTRHNVGFAVADELARRAGLAFESAPATALIARWRRLDGEPVLLVKPMTYMNESGQAIGELPRYFKVEVGDVLVVVDEVQLPLGKLRARARGSAGGHNGLKSAIAHIGSEFPRLRIGVGLGAEGPGGDARRDLADHVLSTFERDEAEEASRMVDRAADAAELFITSGIGAVMNVYNGSDPVKAD
jgi:PTH1 family peptidyl-tRNA hydrolase